jgi:hypothetical protein
MTTLNNVINVKDIFPKTFFQVNALVDQMDEIDLFKNVPKRTFFPVIWFESKFVLAESLVFQVFLKLLITGLPTVKLIDC